MSTGNRWTLNAHNSQTENNLGSALAEEGNLEEARQHFENALGINPDNASAAVNLGNALSAEGGHTPEAIELLTKRLERAPDSPEGQNGLGVALAHEGNLQEATPHLLKAVELVPQDAGYRYNLGRVFAAQSRFAEALPQFEEAARLTNRQDPAVLQMLAAMQSETGQFANAAATAQAALELARQQQNGALAARWKRIWRDIGRRRRAGRVRAKRGERAMAGRIPKSAAQQPGTGEAGRTADKLCAAKVHRGGAKFQLSMEAAVGSGTSLSCSPEKWSPGGRRLERSVCGCAGCTEESA